MSKIILFSVMLILCVTVNFLEAKVIKSESSLLHKQFKYNVDERDKLKVIEDNEVNLKIKARDNYDNYTNALAPSKVSKVLAVATYNKAGQEAGEIKYYLLGGDHVGKPCDCNGVPNDPDAIPPEFIEHSYQMTDKNDDFIFEKDNSGGILSGKPVMVKTKIGKVESDKVIFTYPNESLKKHYADPGADSNQTAGMNVTEESSLDMATLTQGQIETLKNQNDEENPTSTIDKFFNYSINIKVSDGAAVKKAETGEFVGPIPAGQPNPDNESSITIPVDVQDVTPPSFHITFTSTRNDVDGNAIETNIKIGEKVFNDASTNKFYKILIDGIYFIKKVGESIETGRSVYRWLNKFSIHNGGDVTDPEALVANQKLRDSLTFPEKQRIRVNVESYDNCRFRPRRIENQDYVDKLLTGADPMQMPGTMFYAFVETTDTGNLVKMWGNTEINPTFIMLEKFKNLTNKMIFIARSMDLTGNITDITIPVTILDQKMRRQTLGK
ncbi:hypothetical protein KAJ27_19190 [bacterium]|nr:hypothetical protein [bacterium]